jgi:hypothetical protein
MEKQTYIQPIQGLQQYQVVFGDLPKGFPLGRDQEHIIEFVGTTFHDYTLLTLQVV